MSRFHKVRALLFFCVVLLLVESSSALGKEHHVSPQGNDANDGSASAMLKTISAAAQRAMPGDEVVVHQGVYRERINPPRGGESDAKRIVYRAADGEKVEIKGSEAVKGWQRIEGNTWKVTLPNSFFGGFNPYADRIHGDWFLPLDRQHHTGTVYLNGVRRWEAAKLEDVLKPIGDNPLWFGQVDKDNTTLWAQFKDADPNKNLTEINVRQTVFYPAKPGVNYLTVRGFTLQHAATPWAPPTAEQMGLIGTHWSKGWIIENNTISDSRCSGISLGKYGDEWDNRAESAEGYVGTINRALQNGWSKENIGHHIVRNNTIFNCEQTGVVGSMGAVFSLIEGNVIHDIHVQKLFSGAEMSGIKFHGAIDVVIRGNHIYRSTLGVWLDWMAQGARVTGNLFNDNTVDLFVEVNHGPFVIDNNIFLSANTFWIVSQGGAFIHNLIAGATNYHVFDGRQTPLHKPHSTELAGMHDNPSGDDRFYNNVFFNAGDLSPCDAAKLLPERMGGNVFLHGAKASKHEQNPLVLPDFDPLVKLAEKDDGWYLEITMDKGWGTTQTRKRIAAETLGKAAISGLPYERPDGSPIRIDTDYFGTTRAKSNPFPGPFEMPEGGKLRLKVWPVGKGGI